MMLQLMLLICAIFYFSNLSKRVTVEYGRENAMCSLQYDESVSANILYCMWIKHMIAFMLVCSMLIMHL